MQIKVGQNTIEENAYLWIKGHYLVVQLNDVSKGAVIALREAYQGISTAMTSKVKKTFKDEFQPGNRTIVPDLKRSETYLGELKDKMKEMDLEKVKNQMQDYRSQLEEVNKELDAKRQPSSRD